MKSICAWCKKHLKGYEDDPIISHDICESCADELKKDLAIQTKREEEI